MGLEWSSGETEVCKEGGGPTCRVSRVNEGSSGFVLSAVRKLQKRTHCKRRRAWHGELDAEKKPGVVGEVLSVQWWLLLKLVTAQPPRCKPREAEGCK